MPEVGSLSGLIAGGPNVGTGAQTSGNKPVGGTEALGLNIGDLVEVGLAEDLGKGEGIVDIGGRLFRALYPEGMTPGARITLRVVGTGPPLLLKVPSPGEEGLARLLSPPSTGLAQTIRALLSAADSPEGAAAKALLRGFDVLRLPESPSELAPALARLLQKSGLFHEALLARGEDPEDLKSLAFRLLSGNSDPTLLKIARAFVEHVEAHQARSAFEGVLAFPFTLPWGDDPIPGEWVVEEREGRGASGEALSGSLRVRLEMPRLGPIEAAFRWGVAGNSVRLRLLPQALGAVSSRLTELERALSDAAGVRVTELKAELLTPAAPARGRGILEIIV